MKTTTCSECGGPRKDDPRDDPEMPCEMCLGLDDLEECIADALSLARKMMRRAGRRAKLNVPFGKDLDLSSLVVTLAEAEREFEEAVIESEMARAAK